MKRLILAAGIICIGIAINAFKGAFSQGVSVSESGGVPDNSAMLDVQSTSKGILIPRMTMSERDGIGSPATGLIVFCTGDNRLYINRGTSSSPDWQRLAGPWTTSGTNIFNVDGNIGIGESTPTGRLHVSDPGDWAGIVFSGTGLNDLQVSISGYTSSGATNYGIRIQNAGPNPNMIEISSDGGSSWSSPIPITPNIDMGYGVYANFASTYGHTYGDTWVWTVNENFPDMFYVGGGSVGVGNTSPDASAILDVSSVEQGFLPPRMTASQRSAISSPAAGLLVYQTDGSAGYYCYTGTNWVNVSTSGTGSNSPLLCMDYDGNAYQTFTIGTQTWMAENLRVTHYNNGNSIPNVTSDGAWAALSTGASCWLDNDQMTYAKYGLLYNWHAVNDSRGLCPVGWHEPTEAEMTTLINYLGGSSFAGGKMKSGSALWNTPNVDATNCSGFSGLPGSCRTYLGPFGSDGSIGYWWSFTEFDGSNARGLNLQSVNATSFIQTYHKGWGYSVRCVKDD